jgi:ATP-dependent 26S proteasome regulatory subunit
MDDLAVILASRVPIVAVETHEERQFLDKLLARCQDGEPAFARPLFSWTLTDGLRRLDRDLGAQQHNADPAKVLQHIRAVDGAGIYVLLDFHPFLSEPLHQRLLKDIAVDSRDGRRTVILVSHELVLPPDLERMTARFELALPDAAERGRIVAAAVADWNDNQPGRVEVDRESVRLLIEQLAGLTRADVDRLARAAVHDGAISRADLPEVAAAKHALLSRDGVLDYEAETGSFADVGGLANLKQWIDKRRAVLADPAAAKQLSPPRGLLLAGVQGCGKSLAARATAGQLGWPLLRLDMGALYNKYHGETERRLRDSLRQAEAMAPCVLWIDEIEKGAAAGDGDSGTSQRVLGAFLTWLAEKAAPVFVVATANDVSRLPPELVRKGRFDELFFVDLPNARNRQKILEIHISGRKLDAKTFDLAKLARASQGFSGAELEQAVVAGLYTSHATGKPLNDAVLMAEFLRTRPLAVVMAEKVQALRQWAQGRCVPADVVE